MLIPNSLLAQSPDEEEMTNNLTNQKTTYMQFTVHKKEGEIKEKIHINHKLISLNSLNSIPIQRT